MWFPRDSSAEWLNKVDVALPLRILDEVGGGGISQVLEVGVWKGGWAAGILMNRQDVNLTGLDPYPNLDHVRTEMVSRLQNIGVYDRFSLVKDFSEVPPHTFFDLVHVDGEHSEEATLNDLERADNFLKPQGVIMLDDINHLWFPGVSSALHLFMLDRGYRMFLTTGAKGYIARKDFAAELYCLLRNGESHGPLSLHEELRGFYRQDTSVLGQPVLIGQYKDSFRDLYRKALPRLRALVAQR